MQGEQLIVITDHALRARRDFPGAEIVSSYAAIGLLPPGTRVAIVSYCVGAGREDPVGLAEALALRGALVKLDPEKPFG